LRGYTLHDQINREDHPEAVFVAQNYSIHAGKRVSLDAGFRSRNKTGMPGHVE
jgi:hypothetical protein